HNVKSIDTVAKKVVVENMNTGEVFEETYDKLVNTTGSWPITPPIPGIETKNVLLCKNYNQAEEVIKQNQTAKKVVIVGGGYIGIELVEAFEQSGKEVTLIDGLDRILNKYLDPEFTDVLESTLEERGIKLALNQAVTSFNADENGSVKSVTTPNGEYEADLVILCVGFRPNNELLKGKVDMMPNGAILVDDYMRTSDKDIYAAGDSCAVHYNPNGGAAYIPLATNAVRMGTLVGKNIIEPKVRYRGTQSTSGLYLFGYNIGSTGVNVNSAAHFGLDVRAVFVKDNYRPEFMPTTEEVFMKLVYEVGTNRIVGGQIMSKYDVTASANTLSLAIQNKMTIEDLAYVDFFFQPYFDRPWNYLNILAQAACEQEDQLAK
ncbi:FAD-dependent oxidoreductase, partial [Carnobacterium jeotgali]